MKMFLRLGVFVFLGIAFMLVGSTVHAQQEKLEGYTAGGQAEYDIGDSVKVYICSRSCKGSYSLH